MLRSSITPLFFLLVCLAVSGCTPIWTGTQMRNDIDQLKADQDQLTASLREKEQQLTEMIAAARADVVEVNKVIEEATLLLQRNSADFGAEMEEMRREFERLRGQNEEIVFRMSKLEQDLQLFKEDVDLRFADGGGGAQLPTDPAELYKFAAGKFQEGDWRTARRAFETFAKQNPKDRRMDEVAFFVGESFFKEGQWVSAIYEYQRILKKFPKSDRMDDATFRIGEAFVKLGKCSEAQIFFETVVKDFKSSKFRSSAQEQLSKLKGGKC